MHPKIAFQFIASTNIFTNMVPTDSDLSYEADSNSDSISSSRKSVDFDDALGSPEKESISSDYFEPDSS